MDPTIPTPTVCSTVTSSSVSSQAPPPVPLQILEISLISAQDLAPIIKSMRTYAVIWTNPNKKMNTRTAQSHTNPTWNQKFIFRVDSNFFRREDKTVTVEIYAVSWFRDVLVGTVSVLTSDLITPSARNSSNFPQKARFVALQVRRPSGNPQGILNMGVALLDNSMRSMQLGNHVVELRRGDDIHDEVVKKLKPLSLKQDDNENQEDIIKRDSDVKIQLWRSLSIGSSEVTSEDLHMKQGSVVNGSVINDVELCSDIGPSASIVAAEMAMNLQPPMPIKERKMYRNTQADEMENSSILEELTFEEAKAKGYRMPSTRDRWSKEISTKKSSSIHDCDDSELLNSNRRRSRRNSDGGLFSCFGNAYGIEFTIVCGANKNENGDKQNGSKSRRNKSVSETNSV